MQTVTPLLTDFPHKEHTVFDTDTDTEPKLCAAYSSNKRDEEEKEEIKHKEKIRKK